MPPCKRPAKIQDFINKIPINYELAGETNFSVVTALKQRRVHCLEGATVAACALWMQGTPPRIINLRANADADHAVALYRHKGLWGAISKSNHLWLRWRDPIYRSLRELALSYFHEYVMGPTKTLVAYSAPLDLRRFDPDLWISNTEDRWEVAYALANQRHYRLIPKGLGRLRDCDPIEMQADKLREHPAPRRTHKSSHHLT